MIDILDCLALFMLFLLISSAIVFIIQFFYITDQIYKIDRHYIQRQTLLINLRIEKLEREKK